jgi:L-alanine-DL-glutamate epimerase-like enolase superfamily enzyme
MVIQRKRPFRISRGLSTETENLFVFVEHDGLIGLGEMAPVGYGEPQTAETAHRDLATVIPELDGLEPSRISRIDEVLFECGVLPAARAAVNIACWDWLGKRAGLPIHRLLGLERKTEATSLTIGICSPDEAREQAEHIASEHPKCPIKIKMGDQEGHEADQLRFMAIREAAPHSKLRIDANGGWSSKIAIEMMRWLQERGCEYVEQPVHHADTSGIKDAARHRSLPIFLDENIHTAADVPVWADHCDGVNLKLMKTGGISEALRLVHTATALGKQVMIGCMSESSVGIGAGAQISSLFDFVDLDSQFNMNPDPASGLLFEFGRVLPNSLPGLGVELH